ncbi:MAG: DUF1840 domain-containing protein [Rubrivivax sp.]|nr:DUF1840 domain-containing protein [Rubrivivax sp.]
MHYTFKSNATGNLIMMGAIGDSILRIIGKAPADKGIVQASDMPAAIAAIESAVALAESAPEPAAEQTTDDAPDAVTLRQRAWPFVEMMQAAHASGDAITWGV